MLSLNLETGFFVGQLVKHRKFGYRGVIVAADRTYQNGEAWYRDVAKSNPPRDRPWYRVLVHNSNQITYVAERHLELDPTGEPVEHPLVYSYFDRFNQGFYANTRELN